MRDLNIEFLEEYKRVERFIRDAYGTQSGVTDYLKLMETSSSEPALPDSWPDDYRGLKRLRWIRNKLAHEVSMDSDICEKDDLSRLHAFYSRLMNRDDPLARLDALKKQRETALRKQRQDAERRASAAREVRIREAGKTADDIRRKSATVRPVRTDDYYSQITEKKKKSHGPLIALGIIVCLLAVAAAAWIIIVFIHSV